MNQWRDRSSRPLARFGPIIISPTPLAIRMTKVLSSRERGILPLERASSRRRPVAGSVRSRSLSSAITEFYRKAERAIRKPSTNRSSNGCNESGDWLTPSNVVVGWQKMQNGVKNSGRTRRPLDKMVWRAKVYWLKAK